MEGETKERKRELVVAESIEFVEFPRPSQPVELDVVTICTPWLATNDVEVKGKKVEKKG